MKYLFVLLLLVGCSNARQSYDSQNYKNYCNKTCQAEYGTDVDWIGSFSGRCYCK